MALKSETASPSDGMVNVINQESVGDGDDVEDGEIFDDDDDTPVPTAPPLATNNRGQGSPPHQQQHPPPVVAIGSFVDEFKRKMSPLKKSGLPPLRQRRKRGRVEDDRPFRANKQRRKSDDTEKNRENNFSDEDMREMSPLRGDWGQQRHGFADEMMDDAEDEVEGSGARRGGRGFGGNRNRRGRNGRGGGGRRGAGGGNRRDNGQICRFYLQGKCQRGNDCPYSHQQRKPEICKFYMMDCCAKKDRCPFMHSEYPCKYFHSGMKCYAGKKCKFSHGKISPQLKNTLFRDKEHQATSPPPKPSKEDIEVRRERRERNRERRERKLRDELKRDKDARKREKQRIKEGDKNDDKYTLHFNVDPRTKSDDEGPRTPMPSPPTPPSPPKISENQHSDGELRSPDAEFETKITNSPKADNTLPDPKDSGIGEEVPELLPLDLPKHQRELYLRIQQQQREASSIQSDEEDDYEEEKETEDYKEEDWYSSEEDDSGKTIEPITAILNKLKQQQQQQPQSLGQSEPQAEGNPSSPKQSVPQPASVPPTVLPDIDISAVTKLLSTVRETIQLKQNLDNLNKLNPAEPAKPLTTPSVPSISLNPLPPLAALIGDSSGPPEKIRRMRDPRLRGNSSEDDVDLRVGTTGSSGNSGPMHDVDLRQLPFKPAPNQPPANEIDASINAHPPLPFKLIPISPPASPEYSNVHPKSINDPRLKRHLGGGAGSAPIIPPVGGTSPNAMTPLASAGRTPPPVASRDPRQARLLANDPRRTKSQILQRGDSDLRQPSHAFNLINDIDLRLHQPPHVAFK